MNKQPDVTQKTRNKIIKAFCEMYEVMPIEKIYVKDVIKRAGYNRSTFYQYFTDIYSLLDYVENDILEIIRSRIEESGNNANALIEIFEKKEMSLKALFGNYGSIHFLDRIKNELLPYVEITLQDIQKEYRPYIEEFHIYTTLSLFRLWISRDKDISQEKLFELIHILYNDGYKGILDCIDKIE